MFRADQTLVTAVAEIHVVGLILDQQIGLRRSVRLMARQAIQGDEDVGAILRIHQIRDRMPFHRMAQAILQRQNRYLGEVVFRQLHLAAEDGDHVLTFQLLRLGVGTVALEAKRVGSICPQQMLVIVAVRVVASGASLLERGLVHMLFLALVRLLAVTAQANRNRVWLGESGRAAGVRIVAVGAIAGRARMLHLRLLDLLGIVGVAGDAYFLGAGLCQDDFAVLSWLVADIALLRRKRIVQERLHQLGSFRLVRIVARETIRRSEGLSLVSLDQTGIPGIVTIDAQRGSVLGQVKIKFALAPLPRLVHGVAGIAAHVECGVPAAALRNIRSLRVAGEAEIVLLVARGQLQ